MVYIGKQYVAFDLFCLSASVKFAYDFVVSFCGDKLSYRVRVFFALMLTTSFFLVRLVRNGLTQSELCSYPRNTSLSFSDKQHYASEEFREVNS